MIRTASGFVALLALLPALLARDKSDTPTPSQQYQALVNEYQTAQKEAQDAYKKATKNAKGKQKAIAVRQNPLPDQFAPRFLKLAEKNPKDPAAVDALAWVVSNGRGELRANAIKTLLRDHVQSEKMADVCKSLVRGGLNEGECRQELLRSVLENSKHRSAQAQACFTLAQLAESRLRLARQFKDKPELSKQYEKSQFKDALERIVKAVPDKLSKETEVLYERVVKDFADVVEESGGTLGEMAKQKLDALRQPIAVGKPAPEIEGEDIDGKKFKLSDYRGKVVLLDFWGNW